MEPEEREMLEEALELSEQNNKMLKKMQRAAWWGRVFRVLYWIVIIGAAVGAYYYIQPFLEQLQEAYGGIREAMEGMGNFLNVQ